MPRIGSMSSSVSASNGRRVVSVESDHGLYVRLLQTEPIAAARSPSCTAPGDCSPAVTAIGSPMRANRNRRISVGLGNHKRSECGRAEARTCLRRSRRNPRVCIGGPMSDGAASMTPPKSDQRLASWVLWNGWADVHPRRVRN